MFLVLCKSTPVESKRIHPSFDGSLDGIFRYLETFTNDIISSGMVNVSSSSVLWNNPSYHQNNVIYPNNSFWHCNSNSIDEFWEIDFKLNLVQIDYYTLKSRDECNAKDWILLGSTDHIFWYQIHRVDQEVLMCDPYYAKTYSCQYQIPFRYFRVTPTGAYRCCAPDIWFSFSSIEFFGTINPYIDINSRISCGKNDQLVVINMYLLFSFFILCLHN